MDSIDITNSEFSLGNIDIPDLNDVISNPIGGSAADYTIYIYIGIAILVLLIIVFVYKYYINKKTVTFQDKLDDCYGGVCQR